MSCATEETGKELLSPRDHEKRTLNFLPFWILSGRLSPARCWGFLQSKVQLPELQCRGRPHEFPLAWSVAERLLACEWCWNESRVSDSRPPGLAAQPRHLWARRQRLQHLEAYFAGHLKPSMLISRLCAVPPSVSALLKVLLLGFRGPMTMVG